jgi:hypothetical protein
MVFMALIVCKDCKKKFSSDARHCPECGAKGPIKSGNFLVGTFVFLALIATVSIGSQRTGDTATRNDLSTCGSEETKADLKDAIENGPYSKLVSLKVLALEDIVTEPAINSDTERKCVAKVFTNAGQHGVSYRLFRSASGTGLIEFHFLDGS